MNKLLTKIILVLIVHFSSFNIFAQNKLVIQDWQEFTLTSKYGNPISFLWTLERNHKRTDYMENRYKFYIRFKSKTKFKGSPQSVSIGYNIEVDGLKNNLQFRKTLYWDKHGTWDFWHQSASPDVEMKVSTGWIGTFLKEIEKASEKDTDCAEIVNDLGVYTGLELTKDAYGVGDFASGFYDKEIAAFIAKYSKSATKLFKITSSKAFGVITLLLQSDDMGRPFDAYEDAYEKAKGHVYVLEKQFQDLGQLNAPNTSELGNFTNPNTNSNEGGDDDFWNTPETTTRVSPTNHQDQEKIIRSIKYSQEKLKKELENMNIAMEGFKVESNLDDDDCRKTAMIQYHASFKNNAEVLLSIKN